LLSPPKSWELLDVSVDCVKNTDIAAPSIYEYIAKLSFWCNNIDIDPYDCVLSDVGNLSDLKTNLGFAPDGIVKLKDPVK
jgi:hypothetical protein